MEVKVVEGDLSNAKHQKALLILLDMYMRDPMGGSRPMPSNIEKELISELRETSNYVFFLIKKGEHYIGLANCFIGFSTFYARKLLNIHDFAIDPEYRGLGYSKLLMDEIIKYSRENKFCKVTLEVRKDNPVAKKLYKSKGFCEGTPPYLFWEKKLYRE